MKSMFYLNAVLTKRYFITRFLFYSRFYLNMICIKKMDEKNKKYLLKFIVISTVQPNKMNAIITDFIKFAELQDNYINIFLGQTYFKSVVTFLFDYRRTMKRSWATLAMIVDLLCSVSCATIIHKNDTSQETRQIKTLNSLLHKGYVTEEGIDEITTLTH